MVNWDSLLSIEEKFDLHHAQKMKPDRNYTAESYIRAYRPERYYKALMKHADRLKFEALRRNTPNLSYTEYYKTYIKEDISHV
jgi:hypothetical protein